MLCCRIIYLVVIRLSSSLNQMCSIKGPAGLHVSARLTGHEPNQIQIAIDHNLN